MNHLNSFKPVLIGMLAMATGAFAAPSLNRTAQQTLRDLSQGSMAEVQLGHLAQQKSSTPAVKQFAQRMVEDHGALQREVANLAGQEHVKLPAKPNSQQMAEYKRLSQLQGKNFDDAYMKYMLQDHQHDVKMLPQNEKSIHNQKVYSLVQKTEPILQNHLRAAEHVAGEIGLSPQTGMNRPIHPRGTASRSQESNQVQYQNQVNQNKR